MDSGEGAASRVTIAAPGAHSGYCVAPRTQNLEHRTSAMALPVTSIGSDRKKRGRPRKYKPDESSHRVFLPGQLSSSAPPAVAMCSVEKETTIVARPSNSEKKHKSKMGTEKIGDLDDGIQCSTGSSFLPHVIMVNAGEDISTKIMEFSSEGPRAVCIISGSGTVSSVTIRHPTSSGGTVTYEGLFEILSFCGSFTPREMLDSRSRRSGTMKMTLSSADGRVVGGLIAGLTTAASPVKIFVASFLLSSPHDVKPKKQVTVDASGENGGQAADLDKRSTKPSCSTTSDNLTNWAATQSAEKPRMPAADINISLQQ